MAKIAMKRLECLNKVNEQKIMDSRLKDVGLILVFYKIKS